MKKKITILIITIFAVIGTLLGIISFCYFGLKWLVSEQYNEKGISHFLVITIDYSQPKEYMGELDGHKVFVENLNLEETNFRTINAENMTIREAIDKKLVSIEEWRKYAWKNIRDEEKEIIQFENYEIYINYDECIIRPISR